jgi:PAS domain-containing protein
MHDHDAGKTSVYSGAAAATENLEVNEFDPLITDKAEVVKRNLQLTAQVRYFEAILSSISDFAYVFNEQGRFVLINQSLLDLWGLKSDEALGKNFFDLQYPHELATPTTATDPRGLRNQNG